jgi:hypothetical protein
LASAFSIALVSLATVSPTSSGVVHALVAKGADLQIRGKGVLDDRALGAILKGSDESQQTLGVLGDTNALGGALSHSTGSSSDCLLTLLHACSDETSSGLRLLSAEQQPTVGRETKRMAIMSAAELPTASMMGSLEG